MTPYTKLQMHMERHAYKRGQHKGEAPAEESHRWKNHFRVLRGNGGRMCVRMYNTDLISVTEDGRVTISMGGWWTPTTKSNLNYALHRFIGWGGVGSQRVFSHSQMVMRANGKSYAFYDNMVFDAQGNLLSPPRCFSRSATDREATKEFRDEMTRCGFTEVWPILFAAAEPKRAYGIAIGATRRRTVTNESHADAWGDLAAHYKFYYADHQSALRAIKQHCTADMKVVTTTDVTVL